MSIQKINLDNNNELIIRTQNESFSDKYSRNIYFRSISEILLRNSERLLCIGLCSSNTYTGSTEFVQYTPQCILFFRGNGITKSYHIERVFDIEMMQSLLLTKDEISKKYNVEIPEEIKDFIVQNRMKKRLAKRRQKNEECNCNGRS